MKTLKLVIVSTFLVLGGTYVSRYATNVQGQAGGETPSAPTGVAATDNLYNNKVGISWDTIRGATTYRVFRSSTNVAMSAVDIGTTPLSFFFDNGVPAGQAAFYWIRAENANGVSALSQVDQGSRTGTPQQGPVGPLDPPPPAPPGNALTATKAYLGKVLFWDEQMSSTRTVSCGSCHHSGSGGVDPRTPLAVASFNPGPDGLLGTPDDVRGSLGVSSNNLDGTYNSVGTYGLNEQVTGRRSVPYLNAAYSPLLFWDGRATGVYRDPVSNNILLNGGAALESQAAGPPVSAAEMAHSGRDWNDVAGRIAASRPLALSPSVPAALNTWINGRTYPELFQETFGTPDVTPARISMAIASFERTLFTDQAPIDRVNAGIEVLTAQEQRGRNTFNASGCNTCHGGPLMSDNDFHYIGVRPVNEDTGRFQVTGNNGNLGEFRTPSLRNVELRGAYFHNGQFTSLDQVVAFYNRGGDFNAPNKANQIRPLGLNAGQQADLVAFLKRPLTDPRVQAEAPPFDRPTLYAESNRVPQVTGSGRAGSGAVTPQIKAVSPPLAGNPNFTISLSGALGNASAILVVDAADPGVGSQIPVSGTLARIGATTVNTGAGIGWASVSFPIPNTASILGKTFFARWYVTDPSAANGFSVTPAARFTVFGEAAGVVAKGKFADFDGDGKTDLSVFRPDTGVWYILRSSDNTFMVQQWGVSTDMLVPGDYDGDRKADIAVYRNGTWWVSRSRDGLRVVQFGLPDDVPQTADYDGDGVDDIGVFRPSTGMWFVMRSRDGLMTAQFGIATDKPVAADYDGDGKAEPAVFRDGNWWVLKSSGGVNVVQWGQAGDKPVAGDYDGDGKADAAVWRPSNGVWYFTKSATNGFGVIPYGGSSDSPAPGDYDGDGLFDPAVFRNNGIWFSKCTLGAEKIQQWGFGTDKAVPSAFVQ